MNKISKELKENIILYFKCLSFTLPRIILSYFLILIDIIVIVLSAVILWNKTYLVTTVLFVETYLIIKSLKTLNRKFSRQRRYAAIAIYTTTELEGHIPNHVRKTGLSLGKQISSKRTKVVNLFFVYVKYRFLSIFKKNNTNLPHLRERLINKFKLFLARTFFDVVPFLGPCCVAHEYILPGKPLFEYVKINCKNSRQLIKELLPKWLIRLAVCSAIVCVIFLVNYNIEMTRITYEESSYMELQIEEIILNSMGFKKFNVLSFEQKMAISNIIIDIVFLLIPLMLPIMDIPLVRSYTRMMTKK